MSASPASVMHKRRGSPQAGSANLLNLELIAKELQSALEQTTDSAARRNAALDVLQRHYTASVAQARRDLEDHGRGLICAHTLARLEDELLQAIHDYALKFLRPPAEAQDRLCIVAVGGYGRMTLAPFSDIDLLFLLPPKGTVWAEKLVEAILYTLWDLKQKVGHATRTVEESLRQAKEDITIRTAILEARFIFGDRALFDQLTLRFDQEIVKGTAREFSAAKLAERDARLLRNGSSRYLVEPNLKESKGGLRDLNTLFWIAKYCCRVQLPSELVKAGVFTEREYRLFRRCEEFLWWVRCHLHFITGRAEEKLSFELQRQIAERLEYRAHSGLEAAERLMKHYFLVAKEVGDLTAIVCAALEEREAKPRAVLDRYFGRFRRRRLSKVNGDFSIEKDRLVLSAPDVFERDPINLIRLFYLADETGLAIHPQAMRQVTLSLRFMNANLRNDPEANRLFLEILTSSHSPEAVLRLMNEAGVLGRFIPEFGRIVGMMQFNMYHHYTVDEHLLRTVGVLSAIDQHRLKEDHPLTSEILPGIAHRRSLYVACFLHDIAKGRPQDHSIEGAIIARKLCPRLGLNEAETETVAWLIEAHLIMSNTAQGRDLSDPGTIQAFADSVQTLERLKLLLVLTVCDIRAVGPGVWNGWKGELLRTLYWEAELVLAGGHSAIDRKRRVLMKEEELKQKLPGWSDPEFETYAQRHYQAYWLKVDLARKIEHAKLLRLCEVEMRSLAVEYRTYAFRGITELTVVAPDHPRLLSIIAGACALSGTNIADAQIFTTTDGLALDTIFVNRAFERDEDELRRAKRIAETIEKALRGEIRLSDLLDSKRKTPKQADTTFKIAPDVTIDNQLSGRQTVIEVSGLDRPRLLYDLTRAMARLNLNIASSHIVTFGEKAVDSFYVTDLTNAKITSPSRQAAIARQLKDVLKGLN